MFDLRDDPPICMTNGCTQAALESACGWYDLQHCERHATDDELLHSSPISLSEQGQNKQLSLMREKDTP